MKLTIETGDIDVWMILPIPVVIYHPTEKILEVGGYFLKYFLTINIKFK
jgi:hypothetical protein